MALTHTYTDHSARDLAAAPRARLGGPRLQGPSAAEELLERFTTSSTFGSHMPLDIDMHWDWRNPLNLIPALILLLMIVALVAALV